MERVVHSDICICGWPMSKLLPKSIAGRCVLSYETGLKESLRISILLLLTVCDSVYRLERLNA